MASRQSAVCDSLLHIMRRSRQYTRAPYACKSQQDITVTQKHKKTPDSLYLWRSPTQRLCPASKSSVGQNRSPRHRRSDGSVSVLHAASMFLMESHEKNNISPSCTFTALMLAPINKIRDVKSGQSYQVRGRTRETSNGLRAICSLPFQLDLLYETN